MCPERLTPGSVAMRELCMSSCLKILRQQPYLDNYMTDALVEELSRSRLFELTENADAAEVLIGGTS